MSKKIYFGFLIGTQVLIPLTKKITFNSKAMVFPMASLNQAKPKTGASSSNLGFYFDFGARYKFKDRLNITAGLKFDYFGSSYSGSSDRGTPNASSSIAVLALYGGFLIFF